MNRTILPFFVALSILSSCDPGEETPEMLCTPGQSIACACENGLEGAQVCADDGMAFGVCMCEEPPPACSPGEMDACVCDGQELGMRECGEDSVFGECVCENDTSNGDHIPGTQWVLRDKDGNAVPAVFEPVCTGEKMSECFGRGDESLYPCVRIKYLNGNPVWTFYDLSSGKPDACYQNFETWELASQDFQYGDKECSGPAVVFNDWPDSQKIRVANVLYYVDTNKPAQEMTSFYYDNIENKCVELDFKPGIKYRKFEPVPPSITSLLEANAPYTISLE